MKADTLRSAFLACCLLASRQMLCGRPAEGFAIQWGWNTFSGVAAPVTQIFSNVTEISAGTFHSLGLKVDGTVVGWGDNFLGQSLGEKTPDSVKANGLVRINDRISSNVVSVSAGRTFSLAVGRDGAVVGWGECQVPAGLTEVKAVGTAWNSVWALKHDGTVFGWDAGLKGPESGQLRTIDGLTNIIAIAVGAGTHSPRGVALRSNGTVGYWGANSMYEDAPAPTGLSNVIAIAAGSSHTLALKADGTVVGWGFNGVGEATGMPTTNTPHISAGQVMIAGQVLTNVAAIAANRGYSLALKKDGAVVAWGRMVNNLYPCNVPAGLTNVVAIAAGESHCLAITTNPAVAQKFRN